MNVGLSDKYTERDLDRYAYVANKRLSHVDPLGLCVQDGGAASEGVDADGNQTFTIATNNLPCPNEDDDRSQAKGDSVYWGHIGPTLGQGGGRGWNLNLFKNGPCTRTANGGWACTGTAAKEDVTTPGIEGLFHTPETGHIRNAASAVANPTFYAYWTAASVLVGGTGAVVGDLAQGPADSLLFGTRFQGNAALLNSADYFRIGFSQVGEGEFVFRIGGDILKDLGFSNPHINLWPPSWW